MLQNRAIRNYVRSLFMIEILVAEDDEIIQNLIKINLEKAGYLVSVADDGVQAAK